MTNNKLACSDLEFLNAIMAAARNGEWIPVQYHPNGDWSVASTPSPRPAPEGDVGSWREPYRTMDASGSPEAAKDVGWAWINDLAIAEQRNDPAALYLQTPHRGGYDSLVTLYRGSKLLAVAFTFRDDMNFAVLLRWKALSTTDAGAEGREARIRHRAFQDASVIACGIMADANEYRDFCKEIQKLEVAALRHPAPASEVGG